MQNRARVVCLPIRWDRDRSGTMRGSSQDVGVIHYLSLPSQNVTPTQCRHTANGVLREVVTSMRQSWFWISPCLSKISMCNKQRRYSEVEIEHVRYSEVKRKTSCMISMTTTNFVKQLGVLSVLSHILLRKQKILLKIWAATGVGP